MEYKIISGPYTNIQKNLNQWKHEFKINILAMTNAEPGNVSILLTREHRRKYDVPEKEETLD